MLKWLRVVHRCIERVCFRVNEQGMLEDRRVMQDSDISRLSTSVLVLCANACVVKVTV